MVKRKDNRFVQKVKEVYEGFRKLTDRKTKSGKNTQRSKQNTKIKNKEITDYYS